MTDNDGVLQRIREKTEELLSRDDVSKMPTPEDLLGACPCSETPVESK
jgi:hypothetical protein